MGAAGVWGMGKGAVGHAPDPRDGDLENACDLSPERLGFRISLPKAGGSAILHAPKTGTAISHMGGHLQITHNA